jgi:hypothetical protein
MLRVRWIAIVGSPSTVRGKRRAKLVHAGEPVCRVLCEGLVDRPCDRSRRPGPERREVRGVRCNLLRQHLPRRGPLERRAAGQHLEQHTGKRVLVARSGHRSVGVDLLGAHVRRRAEGGRRKRQALVPTCNRASDAEISEKRVIFLQEHVLWLDVAMDDAAAMRESECIRDLSGEANGFLDRQGPDGAQPVTQGAAFRVGEHKPGQAVGRAGIEERKDVRMGEPGRDADLSKEAIGTDRECEFGVEHLDRNPPIMTEVVGEKDTPTAAATEFVLNPVAAGEGLRQVFDHERTPRRGRGESSRPVIPRRPGATILRGTKPQSQRRTRLR